MAEDREKQGETTESTERIPPGSMPPDDESDTAGEPAEDTDKVDEESKDTDKVDEESKDSFPASDAPSW